MNSTSIKLRSEVSKLRQALIQKPSTKFGAVTVEMAEFMFTTLDLLAFADGALYYEGVELEIDNTLPCYWALK